MVEEDWGRRTGEVGPGSQKARYEMDKEINPILLFEVHAGVLR